MALGWEDLQRMKRVEADADKLGFILDSSPYRSGGSWVADDNHADIYVKAKDDNLPHYSRDTYFFSGSIEQIDLWLQGIVWARNYDQIIKLSDQKKRTAKEQQERNRQLMRTIKNGKLATGTMSGQQIVDISAIVNDIVIYADDGGSGAGY